MALDTAGSSLVPTLPEPSQTTPKPAAKSIIDSPKRSEAVTLLSVLQREARLVDLMMEPLEDFQDAQIGAAAREVLRDCRKVIERLFDVQPLAAVDEGESLDLPENPSPAMYRLVGNSAVKKVVVTHRGWKAAKCELPKWAGSNSEALILAPIEVEPK